MMERPLKRSKRCSSPTTYFLMEIGPTTGLSKNDVLEWCLKLVALEPEDVLAENAEHNFDDQQAEQEPSASQVLTQATVARKQLEQPMFRRKNPEQAVVTGKQPEQGAIPKKKLKQKFIFEIHDEQGSISRQVDEEEDDEDDSSGQ